MRNSPYAFDGQMEAKANLDQREQAKRSRGGHSCNYGRRERFSLVKVQLAYIGQRVRKVGGLALACFSVMGIESLFGTIASIKGIGMGGACMAYPLDSGVMAYNPAGIATLCNRLDAGLYTIYNDGSTETEENLIPAVNRKDHNHFAWGFSPEVGMVYHLRPTIALGFLVYNEKSLQVSYKNSFPLLGTSPVGLEYLLEILAPTAAATFFDHHSFSVTLNYMVQRFRLKGIENFDNALYSNSPGFVTNKGYNYSNGVAVTLGYLGGFFNDKVRLGFSWRSKGRMTKFSDYKGFVAQRGTFDIPEVFRGGISVTPFCALTLGFDYQLIRYEQIPALNNGFDLFSSNLLGSNRGTGFGWTNQQFYRVGVNYDFSKEFSLRVGFRHADENFKGSNVATNVLTLDTTVDFLTSGFTWLFSENTEVNGCFAYGLNKKANGPLPYALGGGHVTLEQQSFVLALGIGRYY